jgi:hypothetical protein
LERPIAVAQQHPHTAECVAHRQVRDAVPRTTITIPAGQEGNERPIETVVDSWYSPDLQMAILSTRSDPRTGETVTRYTNIVRGEPAHSLFEVPADYKITPGRGARTGAQ